MISAESTRQHAVRAANSAAVFELYGFKNGATPEQLAEAEKKVTEVVTACEQRISSYFESCEKAGSDPYGKIERDARYYKDSANTAIIGLPPLGAHEPAMLQAVRAAVKAAGFEVVKLGRQAPSPKNDNYYAKPHQKGWRDGYYIELRDPGYVKAKKKVERAERFRKVENVFRRLVFMQPRMGAVLALPAPAPQVVDGVTIDLPKKN
jgi:hypothetical protein